MIQLCGSEFMVSAEPDKGLPDEEDVRLVPIAGTEMSL